MAEDEYSSYNNHIGQTTADDGYDSEEEFIDDTQFEDTEDFVDSIEEAGTKCTCNIFSSQMSCISCVDTQNTSLPLSLQILA